jgi:hypothetical protein
MVKNTHIKTFRTTIVNINKASYKTKVIYNYRQKTPKNISNYFQSIDAIQIAIKDKTGIESFTDIFYIK